MTEHVNDRSPEGFSYRKTKDGKLLIQRHGREIMILKGHAAAEVLSELDGASDQEEQMILAVATGQYRFGNERHAKIERDFKRGGSS